MSDLFENLIDKHKKGLLSEEEISYLLSSTSTANIEDAIEVLQLISSNTQGYKAGANSNKEMAWQKFEQSMGSDFKQNIENETVQETNIFRRAIPLMVMLAMIVVGFFLYQKGKADNIIQYATTQDSVKAISLTDFSQVRLNEASTLKLDADFNKTSRSVNLEGEAFFDVAHNKEKPFVITVKLGSITVLGTQFNVNANAGSDSVTITVKSGKVSFQPNDSKTPFIIVANEELSYSLHTSKALIKPVFGYNAGAWFDKNIKFDATPLSEIIDQLSQIYDIKYTVENPKLLSCKFSGNFNNANLSEINSILSKTFPVQIVKTGDRIYKISGKSCK